MRLQAAALAMSAMFFAACGGGDTAAEDTPSTTPAAGTEAAAGTAAGTGTMAPITGQTHEVQMVGDADGYRYEPAELTIAAGDGVRFVMVSGPPHNVSFEPNGIPAGSAEQLSANMSDKLSELSSNMYMNVGDEVTVSFANVPTGEYNFICTPHLAMGMRGKITVQ